MIRGVKATFSKGVLIPQESLDLEEGEKVVLSISGAPAERSLEALKATAGAWKGHTILMHLSKTFTLTEARLLDLSQSFNVCAISWTLIGL